jgi:hypothetical protein
MRPMWLRDSVPGVVQNEIGRWGIYGRGIAQLASSAAAGNDIINEG